MKDDFFEEDIHEQIEQLYEVGEIDFHEPTEDLLDRRMISVIEAIYDTMYKRECDWWTVIVGPEGTGKSTMATGMLYHYCKIASRTFSNCARAT